MNHPPRLAEALIARFVWPEDRTMVLGDLEEQFHERAEASGAVRAHILYWLDAARLAWGLWWWTARRSREQETIMAMDDLRYAMRRLWNQPLASAVSIVTLACAIGAAAATWSLISAVLLDPLNIPKPDRVFQISVRYETSRGPQTTTGHTYPGAMALRNAAILPLAAFGSITAPTPLLVQAAGEPRPRAIIFATSDFLEVLGLRPSLGRFFTEAEDRRGAPPVAVLSHRFWREELQSDPAAIGRLIRVRDLQVEIIGVAPRGFRGLSVRGAPSLFMPLHTIEQIQKYEGLYGDHPPVHWVQVVGRLSDAVSQTQVQARLDGLGIDPSGKSQLLLTDAASTAIDESSRMEVRQFSGLLASTVALLVAIGSLTVGMLLVLRTDARAGEFAMCLALGASRARLGAGVLMEGTVLSACGALLALPVSLMLFAGLYAFELPGSIRVNRLELSLDSRVLAGTAGAAAASVLLMGAVASVFGLRRVPLEVLRSHTGVTPASRRRRSRSLLVTAQIAITLVLVTGAGLFARSVTRALSLNPGVETSRVLLGDFGLDAYGYDEKRTLAFMDELRQRLAGDPGVESIALSQAPTGGSRISVDGEALRLPRTISYVGVDEHYLQTIGLAVSEGRLFGAADRAGSPPVAILSASAARVIAGGNSVIGRRLEWSSFPGDKSSAEVVGVVPDLVRSVGGLQPMRLYVPLTQQHVFAMPERGITHAYELSVRATGDPAAAAGAVSAAIRGLDSALRPEPLATIDAGLLEDMAPQRFGLTVMGALGAISLVLSLLGMYVLAESMATFRRREMGIRAALGASGSQLRRLLLSETLRLVGAGLLLGVGLSWLGAGTIRAFLFQVEPFDPVVTGSAAAAIIALALAVSLRPAASAARLDLARVLRED